MQTVIKNKNPTEGKKGDICNIFNNKETKKKKTPLISKQCIRYEPILFKKHTHKYTHRKNEQ